MNQCIYKKVTSFKMSLVAVFLIAPFLLSLIACSPKKHEKEEVFSPVLIDKNQAISIFIDSLSFEERLAQLFLVCVEGTAFDAQTGESNNGGETCGPIPPGGYVIFRHNCTSDPSQLISLLGNIRVWYSSKNGVQPFFSIDHEGGYVNRLSFLASPLPSQKSIARFLSEDIAAQMYGYAAEQLSALGFQYNLAPVVEIERDDNRAFLDSRTYGSFEKTITYSKIALDAYNKVGIGCILKHFPGNTSADPHKGLPVLSVSKEELDTVYAKPFSLLKDFQPAGLLMSHALVLSLDKERPACLSPAVVSYAKNVTKINGLLFSDDVLMGALSDFGYTPKKAVEQAILAGIHVIMVLEPDYRLFIPDLKEKMINNQEFAKKVNDAVFAIFCEKINKGLLAFSYNAKNGYEVIRVESDSLYDKENQVMMFNSAKEKGDFLYHEYF